MEQVIFAKPKNKQEIQSLPFVEEMIYEGKENGYWIHLKGDYKSVKMECGLIHESTVSECIEALMEGIVKL